MPPYDYTPSPPDVLARADLIAARKYLALAKEAAAEVAHYTSLAEMALTRASRQIDLIKEESK